MATSKRILAWTLASAAALAMTTPALAQKSKDTVRVAITETFVALSEYHLPIPEANNFHRTVYSNLIGYDEYKQEFVPSLAKAWRRINPTTLEFDLRDDIKFHNGDPFTADDVVYMIEYLLDPKVKLRFKARYNWIARAEKMGPHQVRIHSTEPVSIDLALTAYRMPIFDSKIFAKQSLEDQERYGQITPFGTGPYKVVEIDKNRGVKIERFDGFKGNPKHYPSPIKNIVGIPVPDRQTQMAQLITNGVDVLVGVDSDAAKEVTKNPKLGVTYLPSADIYYFALDAGATAGNKVLADPRVRRAIWMAIDRDALGKNLVAGYEVSEKLYAFCFKATIGCKYNKPVPDYNPTEAKRLLAEAGYPNGFEFKYTVDVSVKDIAEAMAGYWHKIGIKAQVDPVPIQVYRTRRAKNEVEAWTVLYPSGTQPDSDNILTTIFNPTLAATYGNTQPIQDAIANGRREFDVQKRADIYATAYDFINERALIMPVLSIPSIFAHSMEVGIERDPLSASELNVSSYVWK